MKNRDTHGDQYWRDRLTPEQYTVTRQKATERPFSGRFYRFKGTGTYKCIACGNELFSSSTKFDSGSGWPSFWAPVEAGKVATERDSSFGMERTEVLCNHCGAHLGHLFPDGPQPTGQRYCVNSVALKFEDESGNETEG